jgi:hypothetical protein
MRKQTRKQAREREMGQGGKIHKGCVDKLFCCGQEGSVLLGSCSEKKDPEKDLKGGDKCGHSNGNLSRMGTIDSCKRSMRVEGIYNRVPVPLLFPLFLRSL